MLARGGDVSAETEPYKQAPTDRGVPLERQFAPRPPPDDDDWRKPRSPNLPLNISLDGEDDDETLPDLPGDDDDPELPEESGSGGH